MSEPLPAEAERESAFSTGKGKLLGMMMGDPPSPVLRYRATESGLYFINPDNTLYMAIAWDDVLGVDANDDGTVSGRRNYHPMDLTAFRLSPEHGDAASDLEREINERIE